MHLTSGASLNNVEGDLRAASWRFCLRQSKKDCKSDLSFKTCAGGPYSTAELRRSKNFVTAVFFAAVLAEKHLTKELNLDNEETGDYFNL
jgi:hypothetical protein